MYPEVNFQIINPGLDSVRIIAGVDVCLDVLR